MRLRHIAWLIAAALLCAGCGALHVDAYPTAPDTQTDCVGLYNDVPRTVAGQDERRVEDDLAVAWGDPPIILRCGVEKPEQLSPDARCDMVDGIGWFTQEDDDGYLFTTIGRQYYVSVEVPSDYDPAADALVDLGDVIGRHDPEVDPCV